MARSFKDCTRVGIARELRPFIPVLPVFGNVLTVKSGRRNTARYERLLVLIIIVQLLYLKITPTAKVVWSDTEDTLVMDDECLFLLLGMFDEYVGQVLNRWGRIAVLFQGVCDGSNKCNWL